MPAEQFIQQLKAIVGAGPRGESHPEDLVVFEYDGSVAKAMPETVVLPESTEQVRQVLGLAYEEGDFCGRPGERNRD